MKKRRLSEDDLALWAEVTKRTTRLNTQSRLVIPSELETRPPELMQHSANEGGGFASKTTSKTIKPQSNVNEPRILLPAATAKSPLKMDSKTHAKMKRGQLRPEKRIDLHGKTLDQAHNALTQFIFAAHSGGARLVLVITGKGRNSNDRDLDYGPIPVRLGLLREQAPRWMSQPPLTSVILQVTPAHGRHGGQGAYYVYLKKKR